jgi:pimeloyl-ACP methyl ester carboxylesterase
VSANRDVVLIHGYTGTRRTWDAVIERLDPDLRAHAIALPGHRHGAELRGEPTIEVLTDGAAAALDELGLERPHLVGNSMGAWVSLELAARGRAASVLGLCPAGFWAGPDAPDQEVRRRIFLGSERDARRTRRLLPFLYRFAPVRRHALRQFALHGDRLTREQALESTDGVLECAAHPGVLDATAPGARRYARFSCPIRVRLAEHDRLFPPRDYDKAIRRRVPGVDLTTLPGVGHIPMIDDPALVAREIEASVRAALP